MSDQKEPFDETLAPRRRRRCFFCDVDKSDEWKFLPKLNAFICHDCQKRLEKTPSDDQKTG